MAPLQPIAYMAMHMVLVTLTFLLSIVFWISFRAHTAFLIFILSYSAFNGASFYFEVFAHRCPQPSCPKGDRSCITHMHAYKLP
jgi:hypothetical protein